MIYAIKLEIDNDICSITVAKSNSQTVEENEIGKQIAESIKENFNIELNISFNYEEENDFEYCRSIQNQIIDNNIKLLNKPKILTISNIENIYGNIDIKQTICIGGLKYTDEIVYICGKVNFLTENKTKPKEEDGKEIEGKRFLSFSLSDNTGFIKCSIFANSKNELVFNSLENGMTVVCSGKLKEYQDKLNFSAYEVAKCDFVANGIQLQQFPEPKYYYTVKPEQYFETSQLSLFDVQEEYVNPFLLNKSFVVFDFETTGFDAETDSVTELGAVKIVNGKIVETFSTFVNPLMHIPENITALTHITDEMVKDAPLIKDVVVDFYKFCYDSAIVAHNIEFDYRFLSYNANKYGINFNNAQFDTLLLARQYVKGLKNYKLGTICEYMNVELVDAHRAVNDCLATAKLFIKLTEYIKE